MRDMVLDEQKAALLLLQFEDGAKRDTCAAISPKRLVGYIQLAPGETLGPAAGPAATPGPAAATGAASPPAAQPVGGLSDDEVNSALSGVGRDHWVWIEDQGLMAAQGAQTPSITLYLPEAILAMQNESAKKQFLKYEPTEEERQRALTVVAEGYVAKNVLGGCNSITRIILLSDPSGTIVKEAYLSEPLEATWRNVFGTSNYCQALRAKFSLEDVRQVRAAAKDGEFYIAVFASSVNTKMYKIKHKHQSKLGLK